MKYFLRALGMTALILAATGSEAKFLRANDIDNATWKKVFAGDFQNIVIEFRAGDVLPVTLSAEGDFLETRNPQPSELVVKKDFWLMAQKKDAQISLDGTHFKPLLEVVKGSLTVSTNNNPEGGQAQFINILFKAYQRQEE